MISNIKIKKSISLFLSILIFVTSLCSCEKKNDSLSHFIDNGVELGIENANQEYFPGYVHYDPTNFYRKCDELENLSKREESLGKAWKLYDEMYYDAILVSDYKTSAQIGLNEDPTDTYFVEEVEYVSSLVVEMQDRLKTICHNISLGEYSDSFKSHLNNDYLFSLYQEYEPLSEEVKKLIDEENELKVQYINQSNEINEKIADGNCTQKEANQLLGEVYLKLVSVRKKIAKALGYKNYAEYADEVLFFRDYTEHDLSVLKNTVKKYGKNIVYYRYGVFPDIAMEGIDTDIILCDVGEIVSKFSKKADEAYTYLTNNGMISAGFEPSRADTEYTINYYTTDSALVFLKQYPNNMYYNYSTFAHEFGHFTNALNVQSPVEVFSDTGACFDVMELHSTFLETLFSMKTDSIFTDPWYYMGFLLTFETGNIMDGCIYDDWQRAIYESEKDLTIDEINTLYKQTLLDYGMYEYEDMEYQWIWVSHNFTSPMYYVSYAVSYFTALELFNIAKYDFNGAVSIWEKAIMENPYTEKYMEAVKNIGMVPFTDAQKVDEVLKGTIDYIKQIYDYEYELYNGKSREELVSDTDVQNNEVSESNTDLE